MPYDPFRSVANNWHQYCKLILRMHQLSHGPFDLVCIPVSAKGFALFTQQDIGQFRKGLELYHKLCFSGNKIRWKLRLVGFSYDKKSANVVIGKKRPVWAHLKRVKYIWTIRNLPFFACDVSAENTWYMCIILVANIVWRFDHAVRLSYLLNFSFLHHSYWRVFTVFYVTTM